MSSQTVEGAAELWEGSGVPKVRLPGQPQPSIPTPTVEEESFQTASVFEGTQPLPRQFAGWARFVPPPEQPQQPKEPATPSVAAEAVKPQLRLRKRGRLTHALERLGDVLPAWWEDLGSATPALRARSWIESHLKDSGAKVGLNSANMSCGGVELPKGAIPAVQVQFSSEEGTRWLWVCPGLLAHLYTVRLFRPMSEALLGSLRAKARLWAKEVELPVEHLARCLAGTLVLAMLPVPDEVTSLGALRGAAGQWSADVLGSLRKGELRATSRGGSWWDVLRPSLRFGGTRGTFSGGVGCAPIRGLA